VVDDWVRGYCLSWGQRGFADEWGRQIQGHSGRIGDCLSGIGGFVERCLGTVEDHTGDALVSERL
jgi:hypothetical protein